MNTPRLFIFLFPIVLFASCKPDPLETNVLPVDSKMVINSMLTPDNSLLISVTNSNVPVPVFGFSTPGTLTDFIKNIAVNDATVTLRVNGHTDTLTLQSAGMYKLDSCPIYPGQVYQLTVCRTNTGETAIACAKLPAKSNIIRYKARLKPANKKPSLHLEFAFEDNSKTPDYYIASYFAGDMNNWKNNPQMFLTLLNNNKSDFDLINDNAQQNGEIKISKTLPKEYISDTLTLMISPVEEGYYRFLQQNKLSGGLISQLAGEVVHYKSNVLGGYGYFSLQLATVVQIPPIEFEVMK